MFKKIALLSVVLSVLGACAFSWNGPIEIRTTDGEKYYCLKATTHTAASGAIRCYLPAPSGAVSYIDIPWTKVTGLTTK